MSQMFALDGVLDDGSPYVQPITPETRRTLLLPVGVEVTLRVAITYPNGVPVDLAAGGAGWGAWLSVAARPGACAGGKADYTLASSSVLSGTVNVLEFAIPRATFRTWSTGRYFYDVVLSWGGRRYQVVALSGLVLDPVLRVL